MPIKRLSLRGRKSLKYRNKKRKITRRSRRKNIKNKYRRVKGGSKVTDITEITMDDTGQLYVKNAVPLNKSIEDEKRVPEINVNINVNGSNNTYVLYNFKESHNDNEQLKGSISGLDKGISIMYINTLSDLLRFLEKKGAGIIKHFTVNLTSQTDGKYPKTTPVDLESTTYSLEQGDVKIGKTENGLLYYINNNN